MSEWRSIKDDFPSWQDTGSIQLKRKNGEIVSGKLWADDVINNGEDEFPIFALELDNGTIEDIFSFEAYRLKQN